MNVPETLITPAPTDKVAVDAAVAGALLSGADTGGESTPEPDIVQTVEASLAAVDQELAHLEEALRDDLAPFSKPIAAAAIDKATQAPTSAEADGADLPQPSVAADPLAAEEARIDEDIDALIEQTAVAPATAVDTPTDATAATADTVTADEAPIDAPPDPITDSDVVAEASTTVASPDAREETPDSHAQTLEACEVDEGAAPVTAHVADEPIESNDPFIDPEVESLAQSATADSDAFAENMPESTSSSEPAFAEASTTAEPETADDASLDKEFSRAQKIFSEVDEASAPTESQAADEPVTVQVKAAAVGEQISATAAETAAIVTEELAAAAAVASRPSETPALPSTTSKLRSVAIVPLRLAIRLPILLLMAMDLPFRWMSASLKNMIGLVGVATAMIALATFLAAPWLKPAETQNAAPPATTETRPATHTGSPSEPPSSGHPAAH